MAGCEECGKKLRSNNASGYCRSHGARPRSRAHYAADRAGYYDKSLRRRYGITLAGARELLAAQGGVCPCCLRPIDLNDGGKACHVDHSHDSGKVRGILCRNCNIGLGHFGDSAQALRRAAEYLENTNG